MQAITVTVDAGFEEAEAAVRSTLAEQGFGVLTEIDVAATLKAKLGVDRPPMKILGACNPHLAHQALEFDPAIATLLPCNVVVESIEGATRLWAVDPHQILPDEALSGLADDAAVRLGKALDAAKAQLS